MKGNTVALRRVNHNHAAQVLAVILMKTRYLWAF